MEMSLEQLDQQWDALWLRFLKLTPRCRSCKSEDRTARRVQRIGEDWASCSSQWHDETASTISTCPGCGSSDIGVRRIIWNDGDEGGGLSCNSDWHDQHKKEK